MRPDHRGREDPPRARLDFVRPGVTPTPAPPGATVRITWLRKHPELWDARIDAEHRFHGVTGEPLQTDGVVRLTLCIANHYISVWAHVFVHMHADMLLGASSIIENALVIDGADKTIYPKMDPSQCAELSYKLEVDEQSQQLLVRPGSQAAASQRLTHHHGMKIFKTPERMLLKQTGYGSSSFGHG